MLAQFRLPSAIGAAAVLAAVTLPAATPLAAQAVAVTPSSLEFFGFRPGASLNEVATQVRALGGSTLRCDRARMDRRVTECRGSVSDPDGGGRVNLWLSAIDSVAAVLTLSTDVAPDQLDRWRSNLEGNFGRVGATAQGAQWMMQWVRSGRMARLTWRVHRNERVASVSLVDGHVLDGWGRERSRARGS